MNSARLLISTVSVVVVIAVGAGIIILDPPAVQRGRKQDQQRVEDLSRLSSRIDTFWQEKDALPSSVAALEDPEPPATDPATGTVYEYRPGEKSSYQLCASFAQPSRREDDNRYVYPDAHQWRHAQGKVCFTIDAAPKQTCSK